VWYDDPNPESLRHKAAAARKRGLRGVGMWHLDCLYYQICRFVSRCAISIMQVWYDDPESLRHRAAAARRKRLRGVGMWHLDCLDYKSADPIARDQTRQMWAALKHFTDPGGVLWSEDAGSRREGTAAV